MRQRSAGAGASPPRRRRGSPATSPGSCSVPTCLTRRTPSLTGHGPADLRSAWSPQQQLETLLADRAAKLGVEIRRGVELTGSRRPTPTGATVTTSEERIRGGWLVGCDGRRSTVRSCRLRLPRHRPRDHRPPGDGGDRGAGGSGDGLAPPRPPASTPTGRCRAGSSPWSSTAPPADRDGAGHRRGAPGAACAASAARTSGHRGADRDPVHRQRPAGHRPTGRAGCCWPATPPTCTRRSAGRA